MPTLVIHFLRLEAGPVFTLSEVPIVGRRGKSFHNFLEISVVAYHEGTYTEFVLLRENSVSLMLDGFRVLRVLGLMIRLGLLFGCCLGQCSLCSRDDGGHICPRWVRR